jgi:hypothetical protein
MVWYTVTIILHAALLAGCKNAPVDRTTPSTPTIPVASTILPASTTNPSVLSQPSLPSTPLAKYAFPGSIDPAQAYLFYIHGKLIEDQGLPAISPEGGEYEYEAILKRLGGYGFVVISEQRPKNADVQEYAHKITGQVTSLLKAGVPAKNITVVGASKGAAIAIYVSHFLENEEVNFVILAICLPENVAGFKQEGIFLYGNVLSIYDVADENAGSCKDLFAFSEGKGINRYDELVLNIGTGHSLLYKPLDEWITPVIQWAGKQ